MQDLRTIVSNAAALAVVPAVLGITLLELVVPSANVR